MLPTSMMTSETATRNCSLDKPPAAVVLIKGSFEEKLPYEHLTNQTQDVKKELTLMRNIKRELTLIRNVKRQLTLSNDVKRERGRERER